MTMGHLCFTALEMREERDKVKFLLDQLAREKGEVAFLKKELHEYRKAVGDLMLECKRTKELLAESDAGRKKLLYASESHQKLWAEMVRRFEATERLLKQTEKDLADSVARGCG